MAVEFGFVTVKDIAADLGVSDSRVRQLIQELRAAGNEVGQLVGTVRLFSGKDAMKIIDLHRGKREYEKN